MALLVLTTLLLASLVFSTAAPDFVVVPAFALLAAALLSAAFAFGAVFGLQVRSSSFVVGVVCLAFLLLPSSAFVSVAVVFKAASSVAAHRFEAAASVAILRFKVDVSLAALRCKAVTSVLALCFSFVYARALVGSVLFIPASFAFADAFTAVANVFAVAVVAVLCLVSTFVFYSFTSVVAVFAARPSLLCASSAALWPCFTAAIFSCCGSFVLVLCLLRCTLALSPRCSLQFFCCTCSILWCGNLQCFRFFRCCYYLHSSLFQLHRRLLHFRIAIFSGPAALLFVPILMLSYAFAGTRALLLTALTAIVMLLVIVVALLSSTLAAINVLPSS